MIERLRFGAAMTAAMLVVGGCCRVDLRKPPPATAPAESLQAAKVAAPEYVSLFDGKSLGQWQASGFGGEGEAKVQDGNLVIPFGDTLSGVTWTGQVPNMNYELSLEAQRVDGSDFFVGLTFPYGDSHASLILGGWGGALVGLSSIDGEDAAHNSYTRTFNFDNKKWYRIRLVVKPTRIEAYLDNEQLLDIDTEGKKISIRSDINNSKPLGLATYQTTAAYRNIRLKKLD